jgi:hypothetical protein
MRHRARLFAATLTCALALAACGSQPSDQPSSTGGSTGDSTGGDQSDSAALAESASTSIPDDFPLTSGMGGPDDAILTSGTGTGLRDLELCGTAPLRGLGVRDRMVADNSGGESADTRELVLLGSPDEAAQVAQAFIDLARSCDTTSPAGQPGLDISTEVRPSGFGPAPAATLVRTYTFDGAAGEGHTIVHVVPVGAAVLVSSTYGQLPDDRLQEDVDATQTRLRSTAAALEMFGDITTEGAEPHETGSETEPPGVTSVPDDFPLAVGLPEDDGETEVSPPSPDGDGVGLVEMCGREVWPLGGTAGGTRRLATGAIGPEYFDGRELMVHADAEVASNVMAVLRQAAADCRSFDNQVWTVLDRDTGYDTVTVGLTYDDGLGSSVFQVTRVGAARLMVQTYGEGSLASLDEQAAGVTATTGKIVPAMCVFTKTGC